MYELLYACPGTSTIMAHLKQCGPQTNHAGDAMGRQTAEKWCVEAGNKHAVQSSIVLVGDNGWWLMNSYVPVLRSISTPEYFVCDTCSGCPFFVVKTEEHMCPFGFSQNCVQGEQDSAQILVYISKFKTTAATKLPWDYSTWTPRAHSSIVC